MQKCFWIRFRFLKPEETIKLFSLTSCRRQALEFQWVTSILSQFTICFRKTSILELETKMKFEASPSSHSWGGGAGGQVCISLQNSEVGLLCKSLLDGSKIQFMIQWETRHSRIKFPAVVAICQKRISTFLRRTGSFPKTSSRAKCGWCRSLGSVGRGNLFPENINTRYLHIRFLHRNTPLWMQPRADFRTGRAYLEGFGPARLPLEVFKKQPQTPQRAWSRTGQDCFSAKWREYFNREMPIWRKFVERDLKVRL